MPRRSTTRERAASAAGIADRLRICVSPSPSLLVQSRISMDNPIQVDLGRIAQDLQNPARASGERRPASGRGQHRPLHHALPQGTDRQPERGGDPRDPASRAAAARAGRAERDDPRRRSRPRGSSPPTWPPPSARPTIPSGSKTSTCRSSPRSEPRPPTPAIAGWSRWPFRIWTRDETAHRLTAAAQEFVERREGPRRSRRCSKASATSSPKRSARWPPSATRCARSSGRPARSSPPRPRSPRARASSIATISTIPSRCRRFRRIASWRSIAATRKVRSRSSSMSPGPTSRPPSRPASFPLEGHPHAELFRAAAIDALDRLILPGMEREVRRDLTEAAEKHAVEVFAKNLRRLLLQPPIPKQVVLAIDPGFRPAARSPCSIPAATCSTRR